MVGTRRAFSRSRDEPFTDCALPIIYYVHLTYRNHGRRIAPTTALFPHLEEGGEGCSTVERTVADDVRREHENCPAQPIVVRGEGTMYPVPGSLPNV